MCSSDLLQWFCAKGTCPMVIDHTLTMRDRSHFTMEYSQALAPVLTPELKRVVDAFAKGSTSKARPAP